MMKMIATKPQLLRAAVYLLLGIILTLLFCFVPAIWSMPYRLVQIDYAILYSDVNVFYRTQRGPGILFIGYTGMSPSNYPVHLNGRSFVGTPVKAFSSSGSLLQKKGISLSDNSGAHLAWELQTGFPLLCTHVYSYGRYGNSNGAVYGGIQAYSTDRAAKFQNHAYHGYQPKVWPGAAGLIPSDINWIALLANALINSVSIWFAVHFIHSLVIFLHRYFESKLRRRGWRSGRCKGCGYDLSGLTPNRQCPECGRDIPE